MNIKGIPKVLLTLLILGLMSSYSLATVIITNPKTGKTTAFNHANEFKPYGFKKTDYKVYFRYVPPRFTHPMGPPLPPYIEYLIEFKKDTAPSDPYYIFREGRNVHNGSVNLQKELLYIYNTHPHSYVHGYAARYLDGDNIPSYWRPLDAKILWGDIDGDFISDIVIYPKPTNGAPTSLLRSFSLKLEERYAYTKYGPILEERIPTIMQTFSSNVLRHNLFEFATVRLKDINDDGRDELIGRMYSNRGGDTFYAVADSNGVFQYSDRPIGDLGPSTTNDCGINLRYLDYGTDYYTNDTCDTVYVLPPINGYTSGEQFTATNNIEMCRNVQSTLAEEQQSNREIADLTQELFQLAQQQINSSEYNRLRMIFERAEDEVLDVSRDVALAENNLQFAQDRLDDVEDDYFDGFADDLDLERAEDDVADAEEILERISYEHSLRVSAQEQAEENLANYVDDIAEKQNSITRLIDDLYLLNEQRQDMVAELYQLFGGYLRFSLRTEWARHISSIAYTNRNANVKYWRRMPMISGRMVSALPNNTAEYTGVLWTRLLDMENQETFNGDERYGVYIMPNATNISTSPILDEEISYPGRDEYVGEMGLSLAALCEAYPNGYSSSLPQQIRDLPKTLEVNLRQNYQVKSDKGVRVAYNMGVVADRIFNHLLRNGSPYIQYRYAFYRYHFVNFLPSYRFSGLHYIDKDKIASLIHDINEGSWFTIRFTDPNITLANQERIRSSVKRQLIDNVFSSIALEHSEIRHHNRDIASTVLIDLYQLQRFISYNSIWVNADAYRGVYIEESFYTDYQ